MLKKIGKGVASGGRSSGGWKLRWEQFRRVELRRRQFLRRRLLRRRGQFLRRRIVGERSVPPSGRSPGDQVHARVQRDACAGDESSRWCACRRRRA